MPPQVENVVLFLTLLKNSLQENHRPDTEVIWYDSVLNTGQLKWQNKLCAENKIFFDACDGIFLNYNWSASDLRLSAQIAASRRLDVYVGVDVFGRGCLGGGGWNTHVAMKAIREAKLSAAIFAPGWVMENNAEEEFTLNNNRFWELLAPYLHYHVITDLPLMTSFCQGYGNSLYIQGQRVRTTPWTNQSAVSLQPTFTNSVYQLGPPDGLKVASVEHSIADAFNGGGCLKLTGTIQPREEQSKTIIRLFKTSISLDCSNQYQLQLVYKSSSVEVNLFVVLLFSDAPSYMILQVTQNDGVVYTTPEGQNNNYSFIEHCGSPLETSNRWIKTYFSLPLERNRTLQEIRVVLATEGLQHDDNEEAFEIKIGQIKLCEKKMLTTPLSQPINIKCSNIQCMNLGETSKFSFQLTWQVNKSPHQPFCFDVFCRGVDGQAFELQSVSEASDFIVDASKTPKGENFEENQGADVSKIVGNNENADRRETLTHNSTESNKIEKSFGGNNALNYGKFVARTFTCCYQVTEFRAQTKCAGGCVFTIVERNDVNDSLGNQGVVGRFLLRW